MRTHICFLRHFYRAVRALEAQLSAALVTHVARACCGGGVTPVAIRALERLGKFVDELDDELARGCPPWLVHPRHPRSWHHCFCWLG